MRGKWISSRRDETGTEDEIVLAPEEREALDRLERHGRGCSDLFIKTRTTLLRKVNAGDRKAFEEFYNLYSPAMLKYLGIQEGTGSERDQWDIVQTVFAKFYKKFALSEDPYTGEKIVPKSIFDALLKKNSGGGITQKIRFRQYLMTCMKNAAVAKWRADTKKGKVTLVSVDSKIAPDSDRSWKDLLEDEGVDPKVIDCEDAEGERLAVVWDIWKAVIKGFLLDETIDDCKRDIVYESIANGVSLDELAAKWGLRKNHAEVIKTRGKKKAEEVTRAIYDLLAAEGMDVQKETRRLYRAVSSMKPGKKVDRFMIELAKNLCAGH